MTTVMTTIEASSHRAIRPRPPCAVAGEAVGPTTVEVGAGELVTTQLGAITDDAGGALGLAAVIGIVIALWSATSGVQNLIATINAAYDEDETRGFVKLRSVSLAFTLGPSRSSSAPSS